MDQLRRAELPEVRPGAWNRRLWELSITLFVLAVVVGIAVEAGDAAGLNTPLLTIARVSYGLALPFVVVVVLRLVRVNTDESAARLFFWLILGGALLLAALAIGMWATHDPADLKPGDPIQGTLSAGQQVTHHFRASGGDRVVIRVRRLSGDLAPNVTVDVGVASPSVPLVEPDLWQFDDAVGSGLWSVSIEAVGDSQGQYSVDLRVDPGERVQVEESLPVQRLVSDRDTNGYEFEPASSGDVVIEVEPLEEIELLIEVFEGGFVRSLAPSQMDGTYEVPLFVERGSVYLITIRSISGPGDYMMALRASAVPVDTTTTSPNGSGPVAVPPIYGLTEADARSALAEAGLPARAQEACSDDVAEGLVVSGTALLEFGDEVVVAGPPDSQVSNVEVAVGTVVFLSVSNGESCMTAEERYDASVEAAGPVRFWRLVATGEAVETEGLVPEEARVSESGPGAFGSLEFRGTIGDRIGTSFNPASELPGSWSIETWLRARSSGRLTPIGSFFDSLADNSDDRRWYVSVQGGEPCIGVGDLRQFCDPSSNLAAGQWHHLVATYDSGTGTASLYVDGTMVLSDTPPSHARALDRVVAIGAMWVQHNERWEEPFDGFLSRIAIYDRALTTAEIESHLTLGRQGD